MTIMEAAAERERRAYERIVLQAWWNARLGGTDQLKPPAHYLDMLKPKEPQTGEDVLAVFREHDARAPGLFSIKRFGPDGKELN